MIKKINVYIVIFLLSIINIFADGFIVIPEPVTVLSTPFPLSVKYHYVDVEINNMTAVTSIDQEFYNPTNYRLEGYYIFPVPGNAVIQNFTMYINGKETSAEMLEASKAKKIYEDIVRKQLDPALLEYAGQDLFKVRIFPIEPKSTKKIKISYSQVLEKDNGTIEYIYPLNTEKFSKELLEDVRINVQVRSGDLIKNIYCVSHNTDIERKTNKYAVVKYNDKNIKPDRDFVLYFNTDNSKIGASLLTFNNKTEDGYFLLSISPGFIDNDAEIVDKDITFVLDVSGSMDGEKLDKAKKAINFCINKLNSNDRFDVIKFSTEAESLFETLQTANNKNKDLAKKYVNNLSAIGGTNIDEALKLAFKGSKNTVNRPHFIVFITDGKPTIGELNEDKLLKNIKDSNNTGARIFTFGIGSDLNIHLLDKITETTKAYRTYIKPDEDIEVKISSFYKKVESPILTDIEIYCDDKVRLLKMYPDKLPDLFNGASITVLGRYKGSGNDILLTLEGNVNNMLKKFNFSIDFFDERYDNKFIRDLWAARRIGYLLDQIRLYGDDKEIIDEIVSLAKTYGIITPYTSYLIVEDEMAEIRKNNLKPGDYFFSNLTPEMDKLQEQNKVDYYSMKEKSGFNSLRSSEELQELNNVLNYEQTKQGKERLNIEDSDGNVINFSDQVRMIQGRAFYNNGDLWIDSLSFSGKNYKTVRIRFASNDYFSLLYKDPVISQYYCLGKNITFIHNNLQYEVYY